MCVYFLEVLLDHVVLFMNHFSLTVVVSCYNSNYSAHSLAHALVSIAEIIHALSCHCISS
jgi:hypothetical protein